jgi:hypothetical protein
MDDVTESRIEDRYVLRSRSFVNEDHFENNAYATQVSCAKSFLPREVPLILCGILVTESVMMYEGGVSLSKTQKN